MLPLQLLPAGTTRDETGRLLVAGCDLADLAAQHGTPLYLYDQRTMDEALASYRAALAEHWPGPSQVAYAAKAWLSSALARWAASSGLGMDVVSEGELRHAQQAGFPPARMHAHGNNKAPGFLRACVEEGVGRVVLDDLREGERLAALCAATGRRQAVWLRLNPATAADTHAHIETGSVTSKFGLSIGDGSASQAARLLMQSETLHWCGVHFHLGSQMADTTSLCAAIERVTAWLVEVRAEWGWAPKEFSPGGGWAVPYTPEAPHLPPDHAIRALSGALLQACDTLGMAPPTLVLEPGRELVARAGVALYRVGSLKQAGEVCYAFLDGGLADNPRPALYGARYHALLANRAGEGALRRYTLAGPFCESGDLLVRDIWLPPLQEDDLLAVPVSGAYQLSMASTYNGTPRPAVLWLHGGRASVAQARETIGALWARDGSDGP